MESISGVSINGGAVHLTLEGNNRILADMDGPMVDGMTGIKLNNSSTLTMDGDGFLTIGTPGGSVDEGISGYSSTINLDGGQVLAYERFSSTVTIQNKTAVTLQVTGTVQGAALSKEGGPVGGWYGVIPERGNAKLWIPNEDGTYRALLLVNGVIKQFEIVMTNGTPTVTPLSGNASVTLPPEAELPLMADSDGNLCLPGESIVQAGSGPEITVNGDGAVVNPEGEVALPGNGSATVADDSGNTTTITMPETGGTLVPGEGGVILPGGSTVQTGNGPAITVNGDGATVTPEGAVNLPISGSVTVEDSSGNTTTITVPESGGTITPNEDSSVDIPAGSTVQTGSGPAITVTGDGATVTPEGAVNLPSNGSITVEDGSGNTTTITVPESGGTIIPNENGSVNLPGGSSAIISGPSGESTTIIIPEAGGTFDPSEGTITRYYTVTFDSKGGSSVDSIVVTENSPVTKPADPIREGYTFTGWYQDGACTVAWDFANKTVTANTTLYAGWKQVDDDSEDGGSVGGSSSGSSSSVTGSGSNVSVSANGGSVTAYQMESAVKKANEGATITIKATGSSNISLPASGLESAADNDNSLTLDLRYGKVTLSPEALSSVADQAGSTVTITVAPVDTDELNSRQQAAVGDAPVFDLTIRSGSTVISDFGGGLATVSIPYELPSNQDPAGVVVWYMDDDGNITPCETMYDTRTETVIFTTRHFFKYVIGYEEPTVFTDVSEDSYYADSVLWAVENGVTNGTSATTFSPDMAVSRAQMVTFLWRAHGSPKATGTNPFTDVNTSDYYYDAVLWAVENGITVGTSDTTFSPDAPVTRAQAVTFQRRAAGSPVVSGSNFGDVAADAYYADAVTWAVANGITNGTSGTTFSPDVVVSRAQAVTFLWRELA
ncbi:MAG: S-layer homology domain-containing protein [Dysosmobacter sp.]|uniref:S-layer homology domain-containing protein n=1 Tax=Dysosmobacter sp. TaxID=2591382 RepID=UPI003D8D017E